MTQKLARRRRRCHRYYRQLCWQRAHRQIISFTSPLTFHSWISRRHDVRGKRRVCSWYDFGIGVGADCARCRFGRRMVAPRVQMIALPDGGGDGSGSADFFISKDDVIAMNGRREDNGNYDQRMWERAKLPNTANLERGTIGRMRGRCMLDVDEDTEDEDGLEINDDDLVKVAMPTVDSTLFVGSTVIGGNLDLDEVEATRNGRIATQERELKSKASGKNSDSRRQGAGASKSTKSKTTMNGVGTKDIKGSTNPSSMVDEVAIGKIRLKTEAKCNDVSVEKVNGVTGKRFVQSQQESMEIGDAQSNEINGVTTADEEAALSSDQGVRKGLQTSKTSYVSENTTRINSSVPPHLGKVLEPTNNGVMRNESIELTSVPLNEAETTSPVVQSTSESPKSPESSALGILKVGDLVCHTHYGIGRFRGLDRATGDNFVQEFATVEYRDGDIYIPLCMLETLSRPTREQIMSFQRLDSISATKPYNTNIRTRRAQVRHRLKVRNRIREQIVNLRELYAARDSIHRPRYPVDTIAESRFHRFCTFQLTEDQQRAMKEVYRDLSGRDRPMDRLLCGDVGYGKTEIAIRAAFRVLQAGRQVAVIAPTTILALQHFETFRNRLEENYPEFTVRCATRFTGVANLRKLRASLEQDKIRVLIGTHTILSEKTVWNDLGLLIIDEEHRFGVNQKEKIRSKHRTADTLFMSATPIPRTLHLALSGMRDTSVLRNPPPGRKPIETRVSRVGSGVILKAISQELHRSGQVFFVVPRVEGIESMATYLQNLFPKARIMIAHAKTPNLDKRIWKFAHGQYDILLTTTVIENGLDMPHVNTIIVADAQYFGMAQLHQLRGRVGRANRQAFAWLLYSNRGMAITDTAVERLKALQRYSGLGAGFALAQRDMEMRGIGQVLGVEQSGNSSISADEYAEMLHEELEFARTGQEVVYGLPKTDKTEIFLEVSSIIPDDYIARFEERMNAYTRLARAQSLMELARVVRKLETSYGHFPELGRQYISLLELKIISKRLGIRKIFAEREHVILDWALDQRRLELLLQSFKNKRTRARFEAVDVEERVVLRGLGVVNGEDQLAKLKEWLKVLAGAADDLVDKPMSGGDSLQPPVLLERNFGVSESGKLKSKSLA